MKSLSYYTIFFLLFLYYFSTFNYFPFVNAVVKCVLYKTYIFRMENNKMIKLVIVDLDRTLLNDNGELHKDFPRYFQKLKDNNVKLGVATTRPYLSIQRIFGKYMSEIVGVCDNGNTIFQGNQSHIIHVFEPEEMQSFIALAEKEPNIGLYFSSQKNLYAKSLEEKQYKEIQMDWASSLFHDASEYANISDPITNVDFKCLLTSKENDVACIKAKLTEAFQHMPQNYQMLEAGYGWIAVIPENFGKAEGVRQLIQYMDSSYDETIVMGDAENDIGMFKEAKYSFAMKNAREQVKKKAAFVTEHDNNNNGALLAAYKTIMETRMRSA